MNSATQNSDHWNELALSLNDTDSDPLLENKAEQDSPKKNPVKKSNAKKTVNRKKTSSSPVTENAAEDSETPQTSTNNNTSAGKKTSKSRKNVLAKALDEEPKEAKVDLTVGEEKPSRRRRSAKILEKELIQETDSLNEKSNKSSKNKKSEAVDPLSMIVRQIDELTSIPEQIQKNSKPALTENQNNQRRSSKNKNSRNSEESGQFFDINVDSSDFSIEDFFSEPSLDSVLDVSWGKNPREKSTKSLDRNENPAAVEPVEKNREFSSQKQSRHEKGNDFFKENNSNNRNKNRDARKQETVAQDKNFNSKQSAAEINQEILVEDKPVQNELERNLEQLQKLPQENLLSEERSGKRRRHRRRNGKKEGQAVSVVNNIASDEVYSMSSQLVFDDQMNVVAENVEIFEERLPETISLINNEEFENPSSDYSVERSSRRSRRQEREGQRTSHSSQGTNNSNFKEKFVAKPEKEVDLDAISERNDESIQKAFPSWNDAISQVIQFNVSRHSQRRDNAKK